ncbi:DUF3386 family protein [Thermus sediminis]|uniref:DUF3386 family protein n=1 Tax=Thermus sediminis TaxID=1761908 RepID=UPI000E3BDF78|nr:DUF3386 family protein [Thermus sediminis]
MPKPPPEAPPAWALLREARERIYTLPPDFPGFRARLAFHWQGIWQWGEVAAWGFAPEVHLTANAKSLAERELASLLGHRRPIPFDQGEGRWPMRLVEEGPLGARIALEDPFRSQLWVRNGRIALIQRHLDGEILRIHLLSWRETDDGRLLPHRFLRVHQDLRGRVCRVGVYRDEYALVGPYWLPREREVVAEGEGLDSLVLRMEEMEVRG